MVSEDLRTGLGEWPGSRSRSVDLHTYRIRRELGRESGLGAARTYSRRPKCLVLMGWTVVSEEERVSRPVAGRSWSGG